MDWELPDGATRVVLVRHAEPEEAACGRCIGRLDVGLSVRGAEQAQRCASWLSPAGIAALYASPSRRAMGTARPIAAAYGIELRLLDDLRELDFGALEGLTWEEAAALHPGVYRAWMTDPAGVCFPGGENMDRLRVRVLRALAVVRERHPGKVIALVSHGGPIRLLVAHALGMGGEKVFRLDASCGSVTVIDWFQDDSVLRLLNHLP